MGQSVHIVRGLARLVGALWYLVEALALIKTATSSRKRALVSCNLSVRRRLLVLRSMFQSLNCAWLHATGRPALLTSSVALIHMPPPHLPTTCLSRLLGQVAVVSSAGGAELFNFNEISHWQLRARLAGLAWPGQNRCSQRLATNWGSWKCFALTLRPRQTVLITKICIFKAFGEDLMQKDNAQQQVELQNGQKEYEYESGE